MAQPAVVQATLSDSTSFLAFAQFERLVASAIVLVACALVVRLFRRYAQGRAGTAALQRRGQIALVQNLSIAFAAVSVLLIWGSTIAGFALSLAAVAGAMLIVSKEAILCLIGTAVLTGTRPYRLDDFIEIAGIRGQVLRVDWFGTTLAETLEAHQLTGRTVSIPNALLLTHAVRNDSATGRYILQVLRVAVSPQADLVRLETLLLQAARTVCAPWVQEADEHLARVEAHQLMELPSAEPKVLLELSDVRQAVLSLRYACRPAARVRVEQEILRTFWRLAREAQVALVLPAPPPPAAS